MNTEARCDRCKNYFSNIGYMSGYCEFLKKDGIWCRAKGCPAFSVKRAIVAPRDTMGVIIG